MPNLRRSTRIAVKNDEVEAIGTPNPIKTTTKTTKTTKLSKITKKTPTKKTLTNKNSKKEIIELSPSKESKLTSNSTKKLKNLKIGDKLPNKFSLTNQDGKELDLADIASKSHILIFFLYPRASTPGCTRQTKGFNNNFEDYQNLANSENQITIFGLSGDSEKAQLNFKNKLNLKFDLLSDPSKKLITILGANNSGKTIRSHFIFIDGFLAETAIKVSPEQSISKSLEFVQDVIETDSKSSTKKSK